MIYVLYMIIPMTGMLLGLSLAVGLVMSISEKNKDR